MKPIFADTFYWTALTNLDDTFYLKALEFSRLLVPDRIVTSDDVLVEYLAFFAKAGPNVRARLVASPRVFCRILAFWSSLKAMNYFCTPLTCIGGVPTKAIALRTVYRCSSCAAKV